MIVKDATQKVAIKINKDIEALMSHDPDQESLKIIEKRMNREMEFLQSLEHKNIIKVIILRFKSFLILNYIIGICI